MTLLDHLDRAATGDGTVHLVTTGEQVRWAELWDEAHRCAGWLEAALPDERVLAGVLEPTRPCLVSLLGAWLAGRTFASLPHPARGMGIDEYATQVAALVDLVEAGVVLVPAEATGMLDGRLPEARQMAYVDVGRGRPPSGSGAGRLVQFTSGSTDRPRGVVLDMGRLGANARAMAASVAVRPGDVFFSWLPLSHDMGLIGMCLAPAASLAPELGGAAQIWLSDPVRFVRDPSSWLRLAGTARGTITAAPNFALDLVARRLSRRRPGSAGADLSSLRCLIIGSETVDAGTLRRFVAATTAHGLREEALCPAYGLAEATLAVTIVRPGTGWTTHPGPDAGAGGELVALGPAVPGMEVRAGTGTEPAEIQVRGPSVAGELLGRSGTPATDGWLPSGDLGFLHGGQLHFTGRAGDRLVVRGRNLDAGALQRWLGRQAGVRSGCCAVVAGGGEGGHPDGYTVALEAAPSGRGDLPALCRAVADAATRWSGASPARVVVLGRGTLPKTPSGKPQPHRLRAGLDQGTIVPVAELPARPAGVVGNA